MHYFNIPATRRFSSDKLQKLNLFETGDMFADVYCLEPGQEQRAHTHDRATKFYYVLEGSVTIQIGGDVRSLGPGELAVARPGVLHGAKNGSDSRAAILVAMSPNPNHPTS